MNHDICPNGVEPVLELKELSKSFDGLHAVRDVTLRIMPGDRKAIIGPNGAGKTTLFNVISGVFPATTCMS
jgi:branched-chain amino acid transport system ATP-binding protein